MEGGKDGKKESTGGEREEEWYKEGKARLRHDNLPALTSYRSTFLLRTLDLIVEFMNISIS